MNPREPFVSPSTPLLVACLCARWCKLCGDYRTVFAGVEAATGASARFVWIDIEDDEAVLGPVDVEDFPTLLIARGATPLFFGPLTPHPATLGRLLQSALADELGQVGGASVHGLTVRVAAWAGGDPASDG